MFIKRPRSKKFGGKEDIKQPRMGRGSKGRGFNRVLKTRFFNNQNLMK